MKKAPSYTTSAEGEDYLLAKMTDL